MGLQRYCAKAKLFNVTGLSIKRAVSIQDLNLNPNNTGRQTFCELRRVWLKFTRAFGNGPRDQRRGEVHSNLLSRGHANCLGGACPCTLTMQSL